MPVRRSAGGALEVLLVTSRETRRWVIPKGWPWPDIADHLAAAEEAREEAGVTGRAEPEPAGTFRYAKRRPEGTSNLHVTIFMLHVVEELDEWPEKSERQRAWFTPADAANAVDEPELKALILALET